MFLFILVLDYAQPVDYMTATLTQCASAEDLWLQSELVSKGFARDSDVTQELSQTTRNA